MYLTSVGTSSMPRHANLRPPVMSQRRVMRQAQRVMVAGRRTRLLARAWAWKSWREKKEHRMRSSCTHQPTAHQSPRASTRSPARRYTRPELLQAGRWVVEWGRYSKWTVQERGAEDARCLQAIISTHSHANTHQRNAQAQLRCCCVASILHSCSFELSTRREKTQGKAGENALVGWFRALDFGFRD